MFMHTDIYKTLKPVTSKNHVSKRHDAKKKYGQYYTEIEDNPNRVRCTLCNGAFSSANINRHINQKHNIETNNREQPFHTHTSDISPR